ncbi:MAG: hypothetical protein Q8R79_06625 [Legionellaceae bacterium]|nr:hypothetical protein [Legionellaceae bacterium]
MTQKSIDARNAWLTCTAGCQAHLQSCNTTCQNSCVHCQMKREHWVAERYNIYERTQLIRGKSIVLEKASFRDPLACRKSTCDCRIDYKNCHAACRGVEPIAVTRISCCK